MDYSVSENISSTREYDPFRLFQSSLQYLSSDHGLNDDDGYLNDKYKKPKTGENVVKTVTGYHCILSFSDEINLNSPDLICIYEPTRAIYAPAAKQQFINGHDQVSKSALHGIHTDALPYELERTKCSSVESILSQKKRSKKKRCRKPTSMAQSKTIKRKEGNNCKKSKAVKRLNTVQPKAVHVGAKNMVLQKLNHKPIQSQLHQSGLSNLQTSIDYIKTLLK